jgi:hypothetical protein
MCRQGSASHVAQKWVAKDEQARFNIFGGSDGSVQLRSISLFSLYVELP